MVQSKPIKSRIQMKKRKHESLNKQFELVQGKVEATNKQKSDSLR